MSGLNCFEVRIGFMAFLLAASIGSILNLAYGQEYIPTNEEIRQTCSDEMVKADEAAKAHGESNSMMESMFPLDWRIDLCVNTMTDALKAQGYEVLDR